MMMGLGLDHSGTVLALPDGYYYQFIADPRTVSGWTSTTHFHDIGVGDITTFEQTAAGGATRDIAVLVVKAAGMTADNFLAAFGWESILTINNVNTAYGSNDLSAWTGITVTPPTFGAGDTSLTYHNGQNITFSAATWKAFALSIRDTGATAQVGISDFRVRSSTTDVGP